MRTVCPVELRFDTAIEKAKESLRKALFFIPSKRSQRSSHEKKKKYCFFQTLFYVFFVK